MAIVTSFVDICNRAITFLGSERITSLDDDTKEGRAWKAIHEQTRDNVLRAHPWSFAMKRAALAATTTAPAWEYATAYNWPADCLRIVEVDTTEEWVVEGRQILTDVTGSLNILYVYQVTDPNEFDALFIEVYAARIAADIAYEITASVRVVETATTLYQQLLTQARNVDAKEAQPQKVNDWLESRA